MARSGWHKRFDQRSLNTSHKEVPTVGGKTLSEVKGHQSSFSTSSKGVPTVESYIIMARL